jgi:hypothetical protein
MKPISRISVLILSIFVLVPNSAFARGGHSDRKGPSTGPGTGAKTSSTHVSGYTKKDGTHVGGYSRTTPDKNFKNNWSTKGNENPRTGKEGTKVTPSRKN